METSDTRIYYHFGPHRLRFEPPDMLFMDFQGPVDVAQFEEFYTTVTKMIPDRPMYIVRNAFNGGSLGPKARASIIKTVDPSRVAAVISYGSSFQSKVILSMMMTAMRAFRQSAPTIIFVDSEAEARAWINSQRNISVNV